MRIEIDPKHPDPRRIARAVEVLQKGGVISYPTDTVYGIGCDIMAKRAIDRIYAMKRMKENQPLALICSDIGEIARYAIIEDRTYRLIRRLVPGPYCFILPASRDVPRLLQMKRKTVGIRIPHHEVPLAIVRMLGRPLVSTSATIEGKTLDDPAEISRLFHGIDLVLDGGVGGLVPSTVLDLSGPEVVVIREGAGPIDCF
ncbi:MAG: L-threonylcarbamoyladenylate synthase [Sandaracinaceae bacterium]|nr:L-threonylcarbamoyladenylate synthase [Sandaracinaceae bacterium]MDW8246578.1 L-threonylcarbamoyladenylate synthase [Sandaracinaceae bacterium]